MNTFMTDLQEQEGRDRRKNVEFYQTQKVSRRRLEPDLAKNPLVERYIDSLSRYEVSAGHRLR